MELATIETLRALQTDIGRANAEKGFHEEGDALRAAVDDSLNDQGKYARYLQMYYNEKFTLLHSEVTEAHDELRGGRGMNETYYPTLVGEFGKGAPPWRGPYKPEGVPSELADVVIRSFDLADEAGIDLGGMIAEKLRYNATRPFKHGKKF